MKICGQKTGAISAFRMLSSKKPTRKLLREEIVVNSNIYRIACVTVLLFMSLVCVSYGQFNSFSGKPVTMTSESTLSNLPCHYSSRLTSQDNSRIASLRQSASDGDRSQIPMMISLLYAPPHRAFAFAMLRSLSRLGASEALPAFDHYLTHSATMPGRDQNLSNFAQAAKARLIAENKAKNIISSHEQADTKTNDFCIALGLTADDINNQLQAYHNPPLDANGMSTYSTGPRETPVGVYAAGELADMVLPWLLRRLHCLIRVHQDQFSM